LWRWNLAKQNQTYGIVNSSAKIMKPDRQSGKLVCTGRQEFVIPTEYIFYLCNTRDIAQIESVEVVLLGTGRRLYLGHQLTVAGNVREIDWLFYWPAGKVPEHLKSYLR